MLEQIIEDSKESDVGTVIAEKAVLLISDIEEHIRKLKYKLDYSNYNK